MKRTKIRLFAALIAIAGLMAVNSQFAGAKKTGNTLASVGAKAPDFSITDSMGKAQKLSSYMGKIVVLEWLNYDCPFVGKQYRSKNMQTLQEKYTAQGVVWLSVISSAPGKQGFYTAAEVNKINLDRGGHATAILLDPNGNLGKMYDAKTTPDMFVINKKGILAYSGAIDDKPTTDLADVPTAHNFVRDALDALLASKPVKTSYTRSYGCSVKY